jgi:hypothetical protein
MAEAVMKAAEFRLWENGLLQVHAVGIVGHGGWPIGEDAQDLELLGQYV